MAKQPTGLGGTSGAALQSLFQQAVSEFNAGHLAEAEAKAKTLLKLAPRNGSALNLLGGIALKTKRYDEAAAFLKRAQTDQPKNPFIRFNLAEALRRANAPAAAIPHYRAATELKPDFADAHAQLGEALRALDQCAQAGEAYRTAIGLKPNLPVALNGLGLLIQHEGDEPQAARYFEAAIKASPAAAAESTAGIWANLGVARYRTGNAAALDAMTEAVTRAPDNAEFWRLLAGSLNNVAIVPEHPRFAETLLQLFERDDINPRTLASAAVLTLMQHPGIAGLLNELLDAPTRADNLVQAQDARLSALLSDPLLLALLVSAPIPHAGLELLLTAVRRNILLRVTDTTELRVDDTALPFICALAHQCFLNEYVYDVTEHERATLHTLHKQLSRNGFGSAVTDWRTLAIIACYVALHETGAGHLPPDRMPEPLRAVIREQIEEPREEQALAQSLKRLKPIEDTVSLAVQRQYEENPYPRWTRCQIGTPLPFRDAVLACLPSVDARDIPDINAPRILIAGSGTGLQTAQVLNAYKSASIVAVDLSAASLAYDRRKLAERGVKTVDHLQADILDLEHLDERFDLVASFGVIHHMRAPAEGLHVLTKLLKPRGLLLLGLYSEIARSGVIAARELIATRGYPATIDGIRQARREIMTGGAPELAGLLSPASDFWTASDCRDLIFHAQEHRFTLLQIDALLAQVGLRFLGIETRTPNDRRRFIAESSDPGALGSLAAWHAFETRHPETFGETYRLWACKAQPGG